MNKESRLALPGHFKESSMKVGPFEEGLEGWVGVCYHVPSEWVCSHRKNLEVWKGCLGVGVSSAWSGACEGQRWGKRRIQNWLVSDPCSLAERRRHRDLMLCWQDLTWESLLEQAKGCVAHLLSGHSHRQYLSSVAGPRPRVESQKDCTLTSWRTDHTRSPLSISPSNLFT